MNRKCERIENLLLRVSQGNKSERPKKIVKFFSSPVYKPRCKENVVVCEDLPKKPRVPSHEVKNQPTRSTVCFVTQNIIDAVTQLPKNSSAERQWYVDDKNGTRRPHFSLNTHSGLTKLYVYKDGFGEVPFYVTKWKEEYVKTVEAEKAQLMDKKYLEDNYYFKISDEERKDILHRLRVRWNQCNHKFLIIPAYSTGVSIHNYRMALEKEMNLLEELIDALDNSRHIF
ncbi:hypothetical protein Ciccas_005983, partial [Cichlidogyrus casuarinus]